MSINDEPLTLAPSPRAAADARHWVSRICRQLGRDDLTDAATLGTSELVTNALLHASPPITVRVRGTATHPRIEVGDGSVSAPQHVASRDPDDVLATVGRGLSLVAMSATAWGTTIEPEGKIVWFVPATAVGEGTAGEMVLDNQVPHTEVPLSSEAVKIRLIDIDVRIAMGLWRQYSDLRRELRLLSMAHQDHYPMAANLSAMFGSYERAMPRSIVSAVRDAHANGIARFTFEASLEPESATILSTMLEMFDLADAFCKAERLLAIQRTPDQRRLQVWCLSECIRQLSGAHPTSFPHAALDEQHARSSQQVS